MPQPPKIDDETARILTDLANKAPDFTDEDVERWMNAEEQVSKERHDEMNERIKGVEHPRVRTLDKRTGKDIDADKWADEYGDAYDPRPG